MNENQELIETPLKSLLNAIELETALNNELLIVNTFITLVGLIFFLTVDAHHSVSNDIAKAAYFGNRCIRP